MILSLVRFFLLLVFHFPAFCILLYIFEAWLLPTIFNVRFYSFRPLLGDILFNAIRVHWKWKWIITAFKLIIQSWFKLWLFGLLVFFVFFRKEIFDKFMVAILCTLKFFEYIKFFVQKFLRDSQSFQFVFKITISNYYFIKTCSLTGC